MLSSCNCLEPPGIAREPELSRGMSLLILRVPLEPAYDLGVVLCDWNEELLAAADPLALAHEHCQLLAKESGLDEASIWEWGFLERIASGLYLCAYGSREYGQPFFTTAQRLARRHSSSIGALVVSSLTSSALQLCLLWLTRSPLPL